MQGSGIALLVLLAAAAAGVAAQQAENEEDGKGTVVESGSAAPTAGSAEQPQSNTPSQPAPTRFVPKETISPDSVIAFPADI